MSLAYDKPLDDVAALRQLLREQTPSFVTPGGLKHWPAITRLDACLAAGCPPPEPKALTSEESPGWIDRGRGPAYGCPPPESSRAE